MFTKGQFIKGCGQQAAAFTQSEWTEPTNRGNRTHIIAEGSSTLPLEAVGTSGEKACKVQTEVTPPKSRTIIEKISFKNHNIHELAQSLGAAPQKLPHQQHPGSSLQTSAPCTRQQRVSSSREEDLVLERGQGPKSLEEKDSLPD